MLVLQRKAGEEIRIGRDVVVTVLKTSCGKVRLGVQAPAGCSIRRCELPEAGAAETEAEAVARSA